LVDGPVVPVDLPVVKIGVGRPGVELGGGTWDLVVVVVVVVLVVVALVVVLVEVVVVKLVVEAPLVVVLLVVDCSTGVLGVRGSKGVLAGGVLREDSAPVVVVAVQFAFMQRPLIES